MLQTQGPSLVHIVPVLDIMVVSSSHEEVGRIEPGHAGERVGTVEVGNGNHVSKDEIWKQIFVLIYQIKIEREGKRKKLLHHSFAYCTVKKIL